MALKDVRVTREVVPVPDGNGGYTDIPVRGLGASDLLQIFVRHEAAAETLYAHALADRETGKPVAQDFASLATAMMKEAPELLGLIIAVAADEPDCADIVATLPILSQAELLEAVFRLTLVQEGGLGKFVETLGRILRQLVQPPPGVSGTGSTSSSTR